MKGYTVAVGNLNPFLKASREAVKFIGTLDGLIGVHPHYPRGTLIIFETENAAKIAKNKLGHKGIQTGRNICEVYFDEKEMI